MRHRIGFLVALLVCLLCYEGRGLPAQSDKSIDWKYVFTIRRVKHYYDPASVSRSKGIGSVRVKQVYEPTDSSDWDNSVRGITENRRRAGYDVKGYESYDHSVSVFEFDCSELKIRTPEFVDYDSKDHVLGKMVIADPSWLVASAPAGTEYLMPLFSIACGIKPDQINKCAKPTENCTSEECKTKKAVVVGQSYTVPGLKLQLLDKNTGEPVVARSVRIAYMWQWLTEPGQGDYVLAWNSDSYLTNCITNKDGVVEVAEFTVEPRGWSLVKAANEQPRFEYIVVNYEMPSHDILQKCYLSRFIHKEELDRCNEEGNCTIVLKNSCK